jgi:hypothetical protein
MEKLVHQLHQPTVELQARAAAFHLHQLAAALVEQMAPVAGLLVPARRPTKMGLGAFHLPHRHRNSKCPLSTSRGACAKRTSSDRLQDSSPSGAPDLQKLLEAFAARGVF